MRIVALLVLLAAVFWLIRKRDQENQEDKAGAAQNSLNDTPKTSLVFVGPLQP